MSFRLPAHRAWPKAAPFATVSFPYRFGRGDAGENPLFKSGFSPAFLFTLSFPYPGYPSSAGRPPEVAAVLASTSQRSFSGWPVCPRTHWKRTL